MGWAQRGKKRYYYHSGWSNGRPVKTYYGSGEVGEAAAAEIEVQRLQRRQLREAQRAADAQLAAACKLAKQFSRQCDSIVAATLTAAGFHRPDYKAWRRRRVRHDYDRG